MINRYITFFLIIPVLFSSCASILNSKDQEVTLRTKENDAIIYVNGEKVGNGPKQHVNLKRNLKPQRIKVQEKGRKPVFRIVSQYKKSPWFILSLIPFGVLIYPPAFDNGKKAYDYKREIQIDQGIRVNDRQENEKYIFVQNTAFNLNEEEINVFLHSYKDYKKGEKQYRDKLEQKERMKSRDSKFTEVLNAILDKHNYVDSTKNIFRNTSNSLHLNASIEKINFNIVMPDIVPNHPNRDHEENILYNNSFVQTKAYVKWEILNIYDKKLYVDSIFANSGEFKKFDFNATINRTIKDAIYSSLFQLLSKPKVREIFKKDKEKMPDYPLLSLKKSDKQNNLNNAQKSTVTIKNDKSHGSGCVISENGYIVTNYHVVANKEDTKVILNDGTRIKAKITRRNKFADLALLKVDKKFEHWFNIPQKRNYSKGLEVYAIGTPTSIQLGQTLNKGIISGIRKNENKELLQSDVSVSPGYSGGALVSKKGDFLGIVTSKIVGFSIEGINFSIPAQKIDDYLKLEY